MADQFGRVPGRAIGDAPVPVDRGGGEQATAVISCGCQQEVRRSAG